FVSVPRALFGEPHAGGSHAPPQRGRRGVVARRGAELVDRPAAVGVDQPHLVADDVDGEVRAANRIYGLAVEAGLLGRRTRGLGQLAQAPQVLRVLAQLGLKLWGRAEG